MADEYARKTGLNPLALCPGVLSCAGGGDHVTADAAVIDPFALLTAKEASDYAGVTVQAICNWRDRGHLPVAKDDQGKEIRDSRGRPRYRLLDVAKADAGARARGMKMARAAIRRNAA